MTEENKQPEYHQQTLEDLKGAPMGAMQKVIIIAAALFVIGFVIYVAAPQLGLFSL